MKETRQDVVFRRLVGSALVGSAFLSVTDTPYELLFVSYHEEDREARWMIEAFLEEDGARNRVSALPVPPPEPFEASPRPARGPRQRRSRGSCRGVILRA